MSRGSEPATRRYVARHTARKAIFVDGSGSRALLTWVGIRVVIGSLLGGLGVLAITLAGGVPLPGISPAAPQPSGEQAHSRTSNLPQPSSSAGTSPGGAPVSGPGATGTSAGTSPSAPPPTPGQASSTQRSTTTASTPGTRHGRGSPHSKSSHPGPSSHP